MLLHVSHRSFDRMQLQSASQFITVGVPRIARDPEPLSLVDRPDILCG